MTGWSLLQDPALPQPGDATPPRPFLLASAQATGFLAGAREHSGLRARRAGGLRTGPVPVAAQPLTQPALPTAHGLLAPARPSEAAAAGVAELRSGGRGLLSWANAL